MKPMHPRARLNKIIREAKQVIRDVNYYNGLHPEIVPIDCEWERCLVTFAMRCRDAWDSGDRSHFDSVYAEMMEHVLSGDGR